VVAIVSITCVRVNQHKRDERISSSSTELATSSFVFRSMAKLASPILSDHERQRAPVYQDVIERVWVALGGLRYIELLLLSPFRISEGWKSTTDGGILDGNVCRADEWGMRGGRKDVQ
jgi:hypothetical protein